METAKPSISFRCSTELKARIDREAVAVEAKRSDICEKRIAASYCDDDKIEALKKQIDELEKSFKQKDEALNELSEIRQVVESPHFTKLFTRVKGTSDTIIIEGQSHTIIYNSPCDLLKGLIYSFKLKL